MAWGDISVLLSLPGPGLGGPPVQFTGTPEQKERFFGVFKQPGLHWGAYGLTEPGAGSDVAGIRTTCRKDGNHWVLNGRKCFITNGGRADWVVIFATVDPRWAAPGTARSSSRRARPASRRQDRGEDGPPRVRDRGAGARRVPRARRRTCSAARRTTSAARRASWPP